jgi:hypothetical protein
VNQLSRLFAPDNTRDALRNLGGLLIGTGLLMVWLRKTGGQFGGGWGDWGLFVVLLLTFAFLYGVGMLGRLSIDRYRPWAGVYLVFGIIVAPLLLAQFVDAVNGNSGAALNLFWIFLVTAGLAVAAALLAEARYGLLLASLALIVSWSALWDKILSNGLAAHLGIYRGLLLILAALLVVAGFAVALLDRPATVGATPASRRFTKIAAFGNPFVSFPTAASSFFWELVLLVVSLLALGYGAWAAVRGPTYVGAIGLFSFLFIAGIDLNDSTPQGKIVGWPLALVIIGGVAFVASLLPSVKLPAVRFERGGGTPGPPPTAPQPPPPASHSPPG